MFLSAVDSPWELITGVKLHLRQLSTRAGGKKIYSEILGLPTHILLLSSVEQSSLMLLTWDSVLFCSVPYMKYNSQASDPNSIDTNTRLSIVKAAAFRIGRMKTCTGNIGGSSDLHITLWLKPCNLFLSQWFLPCVHTASCRTREQRSTEGCRS